MRIIAGELRGRSITPPEGRNTRPMLDRVREALFGALGEVVVGARVLDLFAGTGSLGLEALSRGASSARFVERDRRAWSRLRENVENLGLEERAELARRDALDPASWTPRVELVFLDPPYALLRERRGRTDLLSAVARISSEVLTPGGALVLHTRHRELRERDLPGDRTPVLRVYGTSALWTLWAEDPPN